MNASRTRIWMTIGLATAALLLSACSKSATVTGSSGLTGVGSQPPAVSPTPPGATPATTSPATSGTTDTTTTDTTKAPTKTKTTTKKASSGPKIDSFVVTQKPSCPIVPTSDAPFSKPGTDIKLKWTASGGATNVALSLDDVNFFKNNGSGSISNYPVTDEVDLAFECDPTVQPDTTHKYILDTIGGGKSVEKIITVTVQTSP
jgi:hypothetical protein